MVATAEDVIPGPGEVGGSLDGMITFDRGVNSVSYSFFYNTTLSTILALVVMGPRLPGQHSSETVTFSLCGAPNMDRVCDLAYTPGQVSDSDILQLEPGNLAVLPVVRSIMANPRAYYMEVLTTDHPTSPGALRAYFTSTCGFP